MSVESKIKELLERVDAKASLEEADMMGATGVNKDSTIKPANSGDATNPKQGDSQDASYEVRDEKEENQGAKVSGNVKKNTLTQSGPGAAPNFTTTADPTSVVGQSTSAGMREEDETADDTDVVAEDEYEVVAAPAAIDLSPIFGDDLSEEFKEKATSIFEAAVIARVNSEMDKVAASLEEKYAADVAEYKDGIVEKIDSYLNYVVENWMKENELALENGLRTEIAEDFMTGLKVLFKEHYIEVPEEKYDVIGELQAKAAELEAKLDEAIGSNVDLNKEVTSLKRQAVVEELSKDLADTEAAKLGKLLEGVDYENENLYREKVSVIKDNYFPKNAVTESVSQSVQAQQTLTEETDVPTEFTDGSSVVSTYAKALSRSIKRA
jgi:phage host-nuclease inhibitor protein Gam